MMKRLAALAVVLALAALATLVLMGRELYEPYRSYSQNQLLVVEPGMRTRAVARLLVDRGVLAHPWPFLVWYWIGRRRHRRLQAGEYFFDRPLTPIQVYRKLVHGDVYLHSVAIPEGANQFDVARILYEQLGMKPEEFLRVVQESGPVRDLDPKAPTLEGFLFPDTYRFPRGVSPETAAGTMLARFRAVLDSRFGREPLQSPSRLHDVLTLASLVEKETPDPGERPIIAGVFARRLEKSWPLDCDPTVVYAARLNHRLIDRPNAPITRSDLKLDSPYNTYRHAGLPPGPICNPGEASVRAALNPAADKFLYFVSNNHGGHLFARTLAEHLRNVARYRRPTSALRRERPEVKGHPGQRGPRKPRGRLAAASRSSQRAQ